MTIEQKRMFWIMSVFAAVSAIVLILIVTLWPMPVKAASHALPVPKITHECPTGYRQSGSYCVPNSPSTKHALPKPTRGQCPTGYREASGGFCLKN